MKHLPFHSKALLISGLFVAACSQAALSWADVTVEPETLGEKVRQYVLESTPVENPEATLYVDVVRLPITALSLKGDTLNFAFTDSRNNAVPTGRTIVQVTVSTEAETRQIGIPVKLSIEKPVWVATKLIRAKEAITAKNATVQTKRLDHDELYSLDKKENLSGYLSRANISPGSILDSRKLDLIPAVSRNEDISIILASNNGVQIKVLGKALENGAMGKHIRVSQRLQNRKNRLYVGEVIGQNTVLVKI